MGLLDISLKCPSKCGKYILTGSATPVKKDEIHHSGAGRICKMQMYTMSLFESGISKGEVSIMDLFNGTVKNQRVNKFTLNDLANFIIKGGWPNLQDLNSKNAQIIIKSYITAVLDKDMFEVDKVNRDKEKMRMLLRSLARNETTISSNSLLIKDAEEISSNDEFTLSKNTIGEYLNVLDSLHLISNQKSYSYKIRSSKNIGKTPKRHFVNPSIGAALLNITPEKFLKDLNTFGLYFEALVERDLKIYMEYLGGHLYHYRESDTGVEVDAILELSDGEYGAVEIKLGPNQIDKAAESLNRFYNLVDVKPKFMCIICGLCDAVVKREDGIYALPITTLKP